MQKRKNKLKYWLKGIIIGAILGIFNLFIVLAFGSLIGPFFSTNMEGASWSGLFFYLLPAKIVNDVFGIIDTSLGLSELFPLAFLLWFILFVVFGFLIGWIIGKVKANKKTKL